MRAHAVISALTLAAATLIAPAAARRLLRLLRRRRRTKLYNNGTQVVMMRKGTRTVLSMQNNYQGPPDKFAMVIPVPMVLQEANVKTLPAKVFERVDSLAAPRLVEYWEQDPCYVSRRWSGAGRVGPRRRDAQAGAGQESRSRRHRRGSIRGRRVRDRDPIGQGLDRARDLAQAGEVHDPRRRREVLRPYVQSGSKFFVAKVNPAKVTFKDNMATLSPLRFYYDSDEFTLPVRLGLMTPRANKI